MVEGHFAEGNKGRFDTYYQILNPQPFAQTVGVTYRHENGVVYSGSLTVGAQSRATVLLPSWLPDGSLGVTLSAAQGFVAERAVYGGTGWTLFDPQQWNRYAYARNGGVDAAMWPDFLGVRREHLADQLPERQPRQQWQRRRRRNSSRSVLVPQAWGLVVGQFGRRGRRHRRTRRNGRGE